MTRAAPYLMNILLGLIVLLFATPSHAILCKTITSDGLQAFMFQPDKTGVVRPTKTVSGTVAALKECALKEVTVVKEVFETRVVPNPITACEKSAVAACEPSFGGLPICTTNNFANFCGFCLLTTKQNNDDVTLRYINGQVYDGTKSIVEVSSCPNPSLLK